MDTSTQAQLERWARYPKEQRTTLSKTERIKRIRQLANMAREIDRIPRNSGYDIGTRTVTVHLQEPPTTLAQVFPEGETLNEYVSVEQWANDPETADGEIVHIYFYRPGNGDILNTITGWVGTKDYEPTLVHIPGKYAVGRES